MHSQLTPCPFCGEAPAAMAEDADHWYECAECGACGPAGDTPEDAAEAWEERHGVYIDDNDMALVKEALQRHGHYLVRRLERSSALPNGADAHALERLRGLMRRLGVVAPGGKDFR